MLVPPRGLGREGGERAVSRSDFRRTRKGGLKKIKTLWELSRSNMNSSQERGCKDCQKFRVRSNRINEEGVGVGGGDLRERSRSREGVK